MTPRSHGGGRLEMRLARGFGVAAHTVSAARLGLQEGDNSQNATVDIDPWPTGSYRIGGIAPLIPTIVRMCV